MRTGMDLHRRALVRDDEELRRQQEVVGRMQVNERHAGLPNWLTISPQKPSPKLLNVIIMYKEIIIFIIL